MPAMHPWQHLDTSILCPIGNSLLTIVKDADREKAQIYIDQVMGGQVVPYFEAKILRSEIGKCSDRHGHNKYTISGFFHLIAGN